MVLIPKTNSPENTTHFRLINFSNVIFKLASKMIANRLKTILPNIIHHTQGAFVPGRQIIDNVLVAFKDFHFIEKKKERKENEVI